MAEKHGKGTKVFVGAYDFSGQGRSLELDVVDQEIKDSTTFSSITSKSKVAGRINSSIDHKGVFTNDTSGWDGWIMDKIANMSGQPISVIPGQAAEGDMAYNGEIMTTTQRIPVKIDDLVAIEAKYQCQQQLGQGVAVAYQIATARGTYVGSGYNVGAAGADDQWLASYHVIEVNNAGTITLKLQECATDTSGSYADVSGTTLSIAGITSKIVRFPGARSAWVRAVATPSATETIKYAVVVSKIPKGG